MASSNLYFVDTNVVLDVLLQREGFYESSAKVLLAGEEGVIQLRTSIVSFATIFYFVKKGLNRVDFIRKMHELQSIVGLLPSNEKAVDFALESNFLDLEDALQYHIAQSSGCTAIITRNKKDFQHSTLAVLTPEELLATL